MIRNPFWLLPIIFLVLVSYIVPLPFSFITLAAALATGCYAAEDWY